jgi:L-lactate permease
MIFKCTSISCFLNNIFGLLCQIQCKQTPINSFSHLSPRLTLYLKHFNSVTCSGNYMLCANSANITVPHVFSVTVDFALTSLMVVTGWYIKIHWRFHGISKWSSWLQSKHVPPHHFYMPHCAGLKFLLLIELMMLHETDITFKPWIRRIA